MEWLRKHNGAVKMQIDKAWKKAIWAQKEVESGLQEAEIEGHLAIEVKFLIG